MSALAQKSRGLNLTMSQSKTNRPTDCMDPFGIASDMGDATHRVDDSWTVLHSGAAHLRFRAAADSCMLVSEKRCASSLYSHVNTMTFH
jgi:hypothetical protein